MFDLDTAIAAWRRGLAYRRGFLPEDRRELEAHLRDHVEARVADGWDEEAAFREAVAELGDYAGTETEYRKVKWAKLRQRRQLRHELMGSIAMLTNYLKIAVRNLLKHKGYAALNVAGLALGIAASLLILQYVAHERSYDAFHTDGDRLYRVQYDFLRNGELVFQCASTFPAVGPAMERDFPEVEASARLHLRYGGGVVRVGDQSFKEDLLFQADPSFLTMFDYPMLRGDRATALTRPNTAVISEEAARKYFGDRDPVGERFRFGSDEEYEITGVIASPETSHLKFTFLLSYATLVQQWGEPFDTSWGWYDFYTYIRLAPGTDPAVLEAKLPAFIQRHVDAEYSSDIAFQLQPVPDIHLHSDLIQEARVNGDATTVTFLTIIAFLILVIAWVNYVNLATARAIERAREIGVRKAVGAHRGQLIGQFLLEALLLNGIAAAVAVVLAWGALPGFNSLVGKTLTLDLAYRWDFWAALIGFFAVGALAAGLYPAFVLSSYRPAQVLKGTFARARQGLTLRKALVVGQFVASVALVAGTLVVYQQLDYMRSRDLGVDIDQMLVVEGPGVVTSDSIYAIRRASFEQAVERHAQVQEVAGSSEIPGNLIYWTSGARRPGDAEDDNTIMYQVAVDYDFLDAYGHELLAGRGYDPAYMADSASVILNEAALRALDLGSPEEAVGQQILIGNSGLMTVVGVVADYHQEGLRQDFRQTAFQLRPNTGRYFSIKLAPDDLDAALVYVEQQYAAFFPENPFTFFFLDRFFDRQYRTERQFGQVFGLFAALAIFVACLGLFGLASFTAARRTKEIGIRKVLGSTVGGILVLLSKDFLKLVLFGGVIAVPIVWLLMDRWLDTFAFRIALRPWVFAAALGLAVLIALATVSYQSVKAALTNPADALRYE